MTMRQLHGPTLLHADSERCGADDFGVVVVAVRRASVETRDDPRGIGLRWRLTQICLAEACPEHRGHRHEQRDGADQEMPRADSVT